MRWLAEEASSSAQIISHLIGTPPPEMRCCPHCNGKLSVEQKMNVPLAEDAAELAEVCVCGCVWGVCMTVLVKHGPREHVNEQNCTGKVATSSRFSRVKGACLTRTVMCV